MTNQPPLNPDALDETALANLIAWKSLPFGATQFVKLDANAAHKVIELLRPHLAAALPEVTSVEELEALPAKTVILDSHGDVSVITETGLFMCDDGDCYELDEVADDLPARVLYRPEVNDA